MNRLTYIVVGLSLLATAAGAQTDRIPVSVKVPAYGVDFHDQKAATAFYQRLKRVATQTCDSRYASLAVIQDDAKCAKAALVGAVKSVNQPLLYVAAGETPDIALATNAR